MYRYLEQEHAETVIGIRGLLTDEYGDMLVHTMSYPHVTIIGKGEIASKMSKHSRDRQGAPRDIAIYEKITKDMQRGHYNRPSIEVLGSTILANDIIAVNLIRHASYATMERTVAMEKLSEFTGGIHDTTPHISIIRTRNKLPQTLKEELYDATTYFVQRYMSSAVILGTLTIENRILQVSRANNIIENGPL